MRLPALPLVIFLVFAGAVLSPADGQARWLPDNLSAMVSRASSSVVSVSATREARSDESDGRSLGSGFIVDASGLVVTNHHVIEGAREIHVTFSDGTRRLARLIGQDRASDLALLRVHSEKVLIPLTLGSSDDVQPGDWVIAIGSPFGLGGSVSAGVVSARHRRIETEAVEDFIQTDAAINRGSSGGPLLNLKGEVVGVNSALVSPSGGAAGISLAVPSSAVKFVISRLAKRGVVERGWVGASVLDLTPDLVEAFGLERVTGALVGSVVAGGPSAKAGIAPGDIIVEVGGKAVADARAFQRRIAEQEAGVALRLSVLRRGKSFHATLAVGVRPGGRALPAALPSPSRESPSLLLGLGVEDLTPALRSRLGLGSSSHGVLVREVEPATPAAEADVRPGDLLVEVGQRGVSGKQTLRQLLKSERVSGKRFALLTVSRDGVTLFKPLRLSEQPVDTAMRLEQR